MEQLIRDLNSPQNQGRPDTINTIQRQIQRLQREPIAWQISLDLLNSQEQLLQFYGALTLGHKVNADWDTDQIGEDRNQVSQLLERSVTSYVVLATSMESEVVISKLASALAAIFGKSNAAWAHPCRHVLACMLAGHYLPQNQVPAMSQMLAARTTISGYALKAVLRLALALQEELGSSTSKNHAGHQLEVQLSNTADDAWQLIHFSLLSFCGKTDMQHTTKSDIVLQIDSTDCYFVKIVSEALQQLPAWAKFVASEPGPDGQLFKIFSTCLTLTIRFLELAAVSDHCMPCLSSLQAEHPRLLARAVPHYCGQVNNSTAVGRWASELLAGEFSPESSSYVDFLEAVISQVDTTTDAYLRHPDNLRTLERAQALLRCAGAAMVEDQICQTVLEIMTSVAEGYSDWSQPSKFDEGMTSLIKDVCLATLLKVQLPNEELDKRTATWEEDDYTRFEDFRFQASDFFQTAFGILGPPLVNDITSSVTQATDAAWSEFEAAIFVLTSVADALSNEPERCDASLNQLFSSDLWSRALSSSEQVPSRVRRSVIRLLAEITSYLQRNPQHLITSLDFLFRSLQIRGHSNHAARTIYKLCDNQRSFLVQALPQFLQTITTLETIPLHSRCKVLGAVSALVQALPSEADKIVALQKMLRLIQDTEANHQKVPPSQDDEIYMPMFDRVSMLAAMGKGLQTPADVPIDLEATENAQSTFWTDGPGKPTQELVLQLLAGPWGQMLEPENSDLVTAACDFLKAGFKEDHPSPFKFSSATSAELLSTIIDLKNPNLDQTVNTTSCFVASSTTTSPTTIPPEVEEILTRVLSITKQSTDHLNDPNQTLTFTPTTSLLDFLIRLLPKYGPQILSHPSSQSIISPFLDYGILLLRSPSDTLSRRSAASFFSSFLDSSDPSSQLSTSPSAAQNMTALLDIYAPPTLALTLHLLAGECARSEIESLSQLLRAFIAKQPARSKRILLEAIREESGVLSPKALGATRRSRGGDLWRRSRG